MNLQRRKLNKGKTVGVKEAEVEQDKTDYNREKPTFCLRYVEPAYCISCCDKDDKASFADMIRNMSQMTWNDLRNAPRHGLGSEKITRESIKAPIPPRVTEDVALIAFRFSGLKPMVGYRIKGMFHIIWFDRDFTLYDHG